MTTTPTKPRTKGKKAYDGPTPEEKLCAELVALLEQGTAPWRRPFQGDAGHHRNLITGAEYRGGNPLLLELGGIVRGQGAICWRQPPTCPTPPHPAGCTGCVGWCGAQPYQALQLTACVGTIGSPSQLPKAAAQ